MTATIYTDPQVEADVAAINNFVYSGVCDNNIHCNGSNYLCIKEQIAPKSAEVIALLDCPINKCCDGHTVYATHVTETAATTTADTTSAIVNCGNLKLDEDCKTEYDAM